MVESLLVGLPRETKRTPRFCGPLFRESLMYQLFGLLVLRSTRLTPLISCVGHGEVLYLRGSEP